MAIQASARPSVPRSRRAMRHASTRFNWAMGIEGEGLSEGMYCVAPDGGRLVSAIVSESAARL